MILAAEGAADLGERGVGELAREVHRDLAREGDGLRPVLGLEIRDLDPEEVADLPLDLVDRDDLLFLAPELAENLLREIHRHLPTGERAEGDHPRERALELPDVGLDAARDQVGDVVGHPHPLDGGLLLQDRDAGLEVGGLDVGDQPPLESRA